MTWRQTNHKNGSILMTSQDEADSDILESLCLISFSYYDTYCQQEVP